MKNLSKKILSILLLFFIVNSQTKEVLDTRKDLETAPRSTPTVGCLQNSWRVSEWQYGNFRFIFKRKAYPGIDVCVHELTIQSSCSLQRILYYTYNENHYLPPYSFWYGQLLEQVHLYNPSCSPKTYSFEFKFLQQFDNFLDSTTYAKVGLNLVLGPINGLTFVPTTANSATGSGDLIWWD